MLKKLLTLALFFMTMIPVSAMAQQADLSGKVTDARTGEELPGVNIYIPSLERGVATGLDGTFNLENIQPGSYSLIVTYVGYERFEESVEIGTQNLTLDIELQSSVFSLDDVVVTALGMQRSERSLGYAVQEVSGQELAGSGETNLVDALAGRTAGVHINSSSGQPGSGTRIIIRGNASLLEENQPLFVIDGVPISNASDDNIDGSALFTGGTSNRGMDIDAANIESMSVLKGASATALYGSRAANGAVIITTKSGQIGQKPTVNIKSSVGWAHAYTQGYQTEYLSGTNGYFYNGLPAEMGGYNNNPASTNNASGQSGLSWGPHKDEVPDEVYTDLGINQIETFDPRADFYQTALNTNQSVSLSGGVADTRYYLSVGNTNQDGITPGTSLDRANVMAKFGTKLSSSLDVESSINYINTSNHWLAEGNGAGSYSYHLGNAPINFDLRQSEWEDGTHRSYTSTSNNPNWIAANNGYTSDVDRFISSSSITYEAFSWLSITERVGIDTYTDKRKGKTNVGTRGEPTGSMFDQHIQRTEINSDLIVNANRNLNEDFSIDFLVGNNVNVRNYSSEQLVGTGLNIPNFFHISNANSVTGDEDIEERRLVSLYSHATVDYQNIVYLTLTARNDWSSTLPKDNNSYFYPSASLGFVFSDAIDITNDFFSFGKLRASISQIGNDAPVYSLATAYTQSDPGDGVRGVINYPFNGVNGYRLDLSIGNPDLKPETTTEYEVGVDLRFFEGRGRLDISYYDRTTVDQIFNVPTSSAIGYTGRLANAGEIRNSGVEISAGATPVQARDFLWDVNANFAKNTTDVVSFAPGVENIFLGGFTYPQIRIEDSEDGYGVIWGTRHDRNDEGDVLIGDDGIPLIAADLGAIGNVQPDWTANLRSGVTYKGVNLSAMIDIRHGGDIMNMDQYYNVYSGVHEVTADRGSTHTFNGVNVNTGEPNDVEIIKDQDYYQFHYSNVDELQVEDGGFVKLRELSLGYTLPVSLVTKTPFQSLTITGTGRNLWIKSDFSYGDPEGSLLGSGNAQGFYHAVTPGSRSFSLSLNVTF
ncbi:MAG: SusC/RagA family TonB-linked outer membrane protein [Balneolales bacterium]